MNQDEQKKDIEVTVAENELENAIIEGEDTNKEDETIEEKLNYRSLLIRLFAFMLCSGIYLFSLSHGRLQNILGDSVLAGTKEYTKAIMIFCHFMSILSLLIFGYYLLHKIKPNVFSFKMKKKQLKFSNNALDWLMILPICAVIATLCFSFLFTMTDVSGSSMMPTVKPDDQLVLFYKSKFERFDIIVIHIKDGNYQDSAEKSFLKRIIGLPGDYLEYRLNGNTTDLYINGELVEESFYQGDAPITYQMPNNTSTLFDWSEKCFYTEDHKQKRCGIKDGNYIIPEGYYFALGDNRNVSQDSRTIGLIHHEDILGVVRYRMNSVFSYERLR